MKKRIKFHSITVICMIALSACAAPALEQTPAAAATAQPALTLGERQSVEAGGYSLQVPEGFEVQIRNSQATISNKDETILVSIAVAPRKDDSQTAESVLSGFLANVEKDINDLEAGDPYAVTVGKLDGLAANITGTLFEVRNSGRATVVDSGQPGFFIAMALVVDGEEGKHWESEGSRVFEAVMNSIEFFKPVGASTTGTCTVSEDPTYGYSEENPIKVGGDSFDGPPRERAYLDNLAGPNGEKISYERMGSKDFADTILDTYVITGLSEDVTLYLDQYSYTEPQAPVGFACLSAFPLTPP
jgi:hypothetical protein